MSTLGQIAADLWDHRLRLRVRLPLPLGGPSAGFGGVVCNVLSTNDRACTSSPRYLQLKQPGPPNVGQAERQAPAQGLTSCEASRDPQPLYHETFTTC